MNPKILLIDDSEQDQKIIMRYLVKAGLTDLHFAPHGEAGVKMAGEIKPDLVLCDTMMPGIDGFETCRQLKQELKLPGKVLIMTGRVSAVDTDKARKMGADDYCVKTADCQSVLNAVSKVFPHILGRVAGSQPTSTSPRTQPAATPAGLPDDFSTWGKEKAAEAIRLLSQELERKNEELKELDKLKSIFISNVSHELRTPLTIIDGAVSQIMAGIYGPVTGEQTDKLAMALKSSERLRLLIEDLLDLARLEAKKVTLHIEEINMVEVVREMHEVFYSPVREKGLDLKTSYPQAVMNAWVDKNRVIQVLTNLLGNALKFTNKGFIEVSLKDQADSIECRVADTGVGIASVNLPKVFERFQQFSDETSLRQKGTGLGLAICKEIVELHSGKIRLESQSGKGSQFIFTLPKKCI